MGRRILHQKRPLNKIMRLLLKLKNWLRIRKHILSVDIKIVNDLAIIGVQVGKLPPQRAEELLRKYSEKFDETEMKKALKVTHLLYVASREG